MNIICKDTRVLEFHLQQGIFRSNATLLKCKQILHKVQLTINLPQLTQPHPIDHLYIPFLNVI